MVLSCRTVNEYLVLDSQETLSKAIPKLKKEKQVIVYDKNKYLGIVTRKHLIREGMNLPEEKISSLVYKPPTITENSSDLEIAKAFVETGAHYLPVLDSNYKDTIVCILYVDDFINETVLNRINTLKVSDVSSRTVITILSKDNLSKALSMLNEYGISKLVVYDSQLKGVITMSTILSFCLSAGQVSKSLLQSTLVKDVMKEEVISIDSDANLKQAFNLSIENNVSSLVVLNNGELFGVITKTDILEQYILLLDEESKQKTIHVSAKFSGINKQEVESAFEQLNKFFENPKIFVYYKLGKEKFRGQPLINCRARIIAPRHNISVSVEGWGVDQATELAVKKLKRRMGDILF